MKGLTCCGWRMAWAGETWDERRKAPVSIFQCQWCWAQRVVTRPRVNPKYL